MAGGKEVKLKREKPSWPGLGIAKYIFRKNLDRSCDSSLVIFGSPDLLSRSLLSPPHFC